MYFRETIQLTIQLTYFFKNLSYVAIVIIDSSFCKILLALGSDLFILGFILLLAIFGNLLLCE